ncbi:bactofilin family protein [Neiella litorisoli]|uniref:bactofilin family protein n=1 Tax=Neiella litorisoli TaxID=2771431 RepID=UPI0034E2BBDF
MIAPGTIVDGTFKLSCNLHIDGEVAGTVDCQSTVTIGRKGMLKGQLMANKLVVSGVFDGRCNVDSLEITKTGKVMGEIRATELIIAKGGRFTGHCREKDAAEQVVTQAQQEPVKRVEGGAKSTIERCLDGKLPASNQAVSTAEKERLKTG